jgi:hypothetical protein
VILVSELDAELDADELLEEALSEIEDSEVAEVVLRANPSSSSPPVTASPAARSAGILSIAALEARTIRSPAATPPPFSASSG